MDGTRSRGRSQPVTGRKGQFGWLYKPVTRRSLVLGAAGLLLGACTRESADSESTAVRESESTGGVPSLTPESTPTTIPEPPPPPTPTPEPEPTPIPDPEPTATPVTAPEPDPEPARTLFEELVHREEWLNAIRTPEWGIIGRATSELLYVRSEPGLDGAIVDTTFARHLLVISDVLEGDPVEGDYRWFRVGDDRFVTAAFVEPFIAPEIERAYDGHWIDVNLTRFYAVAYDGWNPRYAAIITAGRGERTPKGVYEILYRVRNETMDSETVGIPPGDPEYYYLENVEYSQYFKYGGYAIHGNYWTEPQNFGAFSSNGCVGLMNRDAAWFWEFLDVGSTVSIHF